MTVYQQGELKAHAAEVVAGALEQLAQWQAKQARKIQGFRDLELSPAYERPMKRSVVDPELLGDITQR